MTTDVEPTDVGGILWDWPNQQVVHLDYRGPGVNTPPVEPPPPDITSITPPGPFPNTANVPVVMHGTHFVEPLMVSFDGFTLATAVWISDTQINVTLEVMSLAPGTKDLSVMNLGEGNMSAAFPVVVTL